MARGVEGGGIEPEAIDCSPEKVVLVRAKKAARRRLIMFPLLEGVDLAPCIGDVADGNDLGEEGKGSRDWARHVCGLTRVVSDKLDSVLEWAKLGFGGLVEDGKFLGGGEDVAEVVTGCCKGENVWDGGARLKDLEDELIG